MPESVDVRISTKADLSGIDKTGQAFKTLASTMQKSNTATGALVRGVTDLAFMRGKILFVAAAAKELWQTMQGVYNVVKEINADGLDSVVARVVYGKDPKALNEQARNTAKSVQAVVDALNSLNVRTGQAKELQELQNLINGISDEAGRRSGQREVSQMAIEIWDQVEAGRKKYETALKEKKLKEDELQLRFRMAADDRKSAASRLLDLEVIKSVIEQRRQLSSTAYFTDGIISTDEQRKQELDDLKALYSVEVQIAEVRREMYGETFSGRFRENMRALTTGFENWSVSAANAVTGGIGAALAGIDSAVVGLIQGTVTWGQAFLQVGNMIVSELARIAVRAIVVRAILAPLGLASFAIPGFASGGLIPGTPSSSDNRLAMVATGEYIARSAAVQYYGAGVFEALNSMQIPRDMLASFNMPTRQTPKSSFATGGFVGSGGGINVSPAPVTVVVVNDQKQALNALKSYSGRKVLYQLNTGLKTDLGIT